MLTMSPVIKAALIGVAIQSSVAFAQEATGLDSVQLRNGYKLTVQQNKLVEIDVTHGRVSKVQGPFRLNRLISKSSSVAFPVSHSRIIDGKEYVLVVISQSSSNNPMGFCGAGEEGALYVLNINDMHANSRFVLPVQSCLNNISLATATGVKSPYSSIEWSDAPVGIKISWECYRGNGAASRIYRYVNGDFYR